MSAHLEGELLESLALGAEPEAAAQAHLSQCEQCARELAWARVERALLQCRRASRSDARIGRAGRCAWERLLPAWQRQRWFCSPYIR